MNESTKRLLARVNGVDEAYRKQLTAEEISNEYSLSKEIGIIGDALEYLFSIVSQLHGGVVPDDAFNEWRNKVADIKQKIKDEMYINY